MTNIKGKWQLAFGRQAGSQARNRNRQTDLAGSRGETPRRLVTSSRLVCLRVRELGTAHPKAETRA